MPRPEHPAGVEAPAADRPQLDPVDGVAPVAQPHGVGLWQRVGDRGVVEEAPHRPDRQGGAQHQQHGGGGHHPGHGPRPPPDGEPGQRRQDQAHDRGVISEGHRRDARAGEHRQRQPGPPAPGPATGRQRPDQAQHLGGMADVGFREVRPDRLVEDVQRLVDRRVRHRLDQQDQAEQRATPGQHLQGPGAQHRIGAPRRGDRAPIERQLEGELQDGGIAGLGRVIGAPQGGDRGPDQGGEQDQGGGPVLVRHAHRGQAEQAEQRRGDPQADGREPGQQRHERRHADQDPAAPDRQAVALSRRGQARRPCNEAQAHGQVLLAHGHQFFGQRRVNRAGGVPLALGDAHLHGDGRHLDHLRRVRPDDVAAEDLLGRAIHDELQERAFVAADEGVFHRPEPGRGRRRPCRTACGRPPR